MPKKKIATEERYDALTRAIAGGELQMVKFLWSIIEEIGKVTDGVDNDVETIRSRVTAYLDRLEKNPPKDGKNPTKEELVALMKPLIPDPIPGEDGHTPTDEELYEIIEPLIPDAPEPIKPTKKELREIMKPMLKRGPRGFAPKHEWNRTRVRFMNPDGEWGEWVDLRGPAGEAHPESGPGGGMAVPTFTVRKGSTRFEGVAEIVFADNLTVTRTSNGVSVSGEDGGGGSGGGLDFETPTGTVNDSNVNFTATEVPLYLVVNGAQYFEGVHYSRSGLDITLDDPVGTGGFIRSAYGTGISVETPTGTVNDANTSFTVSNEPKYIVVNGAQYFDGAGYSYSGGTLTLDNPVGTGGFIRSVY